MQGVLLLVAEQQAAADAGGGQELLVQGVRDRLKEHDVLQRFTGRGEDRCARWYPELPLLRFHASV
ncbi:hypothetical protein GCM10017781_38550 [Deinococcus metalli]|uniref:Uncharacterized protein n=1 Tax=Deinococcus metalli TaxID=1141878 RepID=A0ABQ3JSA1_9DEIO|nr:hypothetical protein GCM10017781_38550 [Deinococcus metalli]